MYQFILLLGFLLTFSALGQKDQELYCGVCRALVDEVNWKIKQVDPKEKVQIGSFRVDPKGNQQTYEIPFARSEIHLTDVFESICEEFKNYAQGKDRSGRKTVIRTSSRNGEAVSLSDVSLSSDIQKKIKYICEKIVEEHEEDMIPLFKDEDSGIERNICQNELKLCTEAMMKESFVPKPKLPQAEEKGTDVVNEDIKDTDHKEL